VLADANVTRQAVLLTRNPDGQTPAASLYLGNCGTKGANG
jgi:hypothetical protein